MEEKKFDSNFENNGIIEDSANEVALDASAFQDSADCQVGLEGEKEKSDEIIADSSLKKVKKSWGRTNRILNVVIYLLTIILTVNITLIVNKKFSDSPSQKLNEISKLVEKYYDGEIDKTQVDDALATAYIKALNDKYAFYRNSEDAEVVTNSFEGNTSGIGVTVYYHATKKYLGVFRIDRDSPADKAGIKTGDKITHIDGKSVAELGYTAAVNAIKRKIGEKADITVDRDGKTINFKVEYQEFVRQTVYSRQIGDYGYMCFTNFNDATVEQFNSDLDALLKAGVKGLIFDMRGNGGGTVDSVCKILDRLVGKCDLMTIEYADGSRTVTDTSDSKKLDIPMTVLTDGDTASAAELFAATIRNMNGGALVGSTTFGKGVVQRTYYLSDGSCVRFTVGEFFPAGGEGFNGVGLDPDYEVSFNDKESSNQFILGDDDPFIKKAIEHLKGTAKS